MQETSVKGDPQSICVAEISVNVIKRHVSSIKLVVVSIDHDLTWFVPHAVSMHRRFAVGRDGKTAYERNVGKRAVLPWHRFGERVWWMPLQTTNRRLGPLDSRFEQGSYLGPMYGSNTEFVGTAS